MRKLALPFAALLAAIVGCTASPLATEFSGFDADARLTGRFTYGGMPPSVWGHAPQLIRPQYRPAGAEPGNDKLGATLYQDGYFAFRQPDIASGDYQIVYSDGGELVGSGYNTVSYLVSDPITAPPRKFGKDDAQAKLDLKWEIKDFAPGVDGKISDGKIAFTDFSGAPPATADYFVQVSYLPRKIGGQDSKPEEGKTFQKTLCWTSAATPRATPSMSVTWPGRCNEALTESEWDPGATPSTEVAPDSYLFYRVGFLTAGATLSDFVKGLKVLHGRTAWIPFQQ